MDMTCFALGVTTCLSIEFLLVVIYGLYELSRTRRKK